MAQKRHGVDQIIPMLRRADVELGKGKKVPEVSKRLGITQQTYYLWHTSRRALWIGRVVASGQQ